MLHAEGHDVRVLPVNDDLYSSPPDRIQDHRGIAGDMAAFKIAGAVCAAGMDLDPVEALAIRANACTRSLGVALCVCKLSGSDKLVFRVPEGRMSLGARNSRRAWKRSNRSANYRRFGGYAGPMSHG